MYNQTEPYCLYMSIKKSILEQKWYYRTLKVLFLILPVFVGVDAYLIKGITADNIQKNAIILAVGVVAYYIIINAILRIFLYIAFGGLEDDTKKMVNGPGTAQIVVQPAQVSPKPSASSSSSAGVFFFIMIMIIVFIIAYAASQTSTTTTDQSSSAGGDSSGSTCTPTGCGNLWSCSGTYYSGGEQYRANGECYPSGGRPGDLYSGWSGTCRQCP